LANDLEYSSVSIERHTDGGQSDKCGTSRSLFVVGLVG
jgi:hypothetical protein